MRTLTPQQWATLTCAAGYTVCARVLVLGPGNLWMNLTGLGPSDMLDFLEEATVDEQLDAPVAHATVRVRREVAGFSLAPLMTTSPLNTYAGAYAPLLREGRTFTVEVAVCPLGMEPGDVDWMELFRGRIDEVDSAAEVLTFSGRDFAGLLQDSFIESERTYGNLDAVNGDELQAICQALLTDNGQASFPFHVPVAPLSRRGPYIQKAEPLLESLRFLAQQSGWEVRWKWRGPPTNAWALLLWCPDRTATNPVWTFNPAAYRELSSVRTSLADVRNVWSGVYSDRFDLDAAGQPKRKTVQVSDAASIAAYGRRWAQVAEEATSPIDTPAEMLRMLNAGLADMKQPWLQLEAEVDLHPFLELGDLLAFADNGAHFAATQVAALVQVTHTLGSSGGRTKLVCCGKPSTSPRAWLSLEARPGLAPSPPFTPPQPPTGLLATPTVNGFALTFSPPTTGAEAVEYELHVGATPGFTLGQAKATGSTTRFEVADLPPGTTYYAKVVARDSKGNRGAPSSEVAITTLYVEPRLLQPYVQQGSIVPNDSFEACNVAAAPPDTWTLLNGTWGTTAARIADSFSGATAVRFSGGATNTLASQYVTVRPGDIYAVEAWAKRTTATGSNVASLLLDYVDGTFNILSVVSVLVNPTPADGWRHFYNVGTAPAGARYLRVRLNQGNITPDALIWDAVRVTLVRSLMEPLNLVDSSSATFASGFANVNTYQGQYTVAAFYKGADDTVFLEGRVTRAGGVPPFGTAILNGLPTGYRPRAEVTLLVATNAGAGVITITPAGSVLYQSGGVGWLSLDGVHFRGSP